VLTAARTGVLVLACVAASIGPAGAESGIAGVGGGLYRCMFAFGSVPRGNAYLYACFEYGPAAGAMSGGTPAATVEYISGYVAVMTDKGIDQRTFGFDPLAPSSPDLEAATGMTMDPAMRSGTLALNVATITVNITSTGIGLPRAWDSQYVDEYVDNRSKGGSSQVCALSGAWVGTWRDATVTGSIKSSKRGGGKLSGGGGTMSQGTGASTHMEATPGTKTRCDFR
jgi:hypothetical protein